MTSLIYSLIAIGLTVAILYGLSLMSQVRSSVRGNAICTAAMVLAMLITVFNAGAFFSPAVMLSLIIGGLIGLFLSNKVKMIQMPQLVAFLNGIGGGAAAIVGFLVILDNPSLNAFERISAGLAVLTGMMTIAGAFVAAGKLHHILPQKVILLPAHNTISSALLGSMITASIVMLFPVENALIPLATVLFFSGALFGVVFAIRIGGADMPITISLLNSLAGVSGAIAGFAISDPLLVAIGGIVGSAGLLLTQVMCRAMNRKLVDILFSGSSGAKTQSKEASQTPQQETSSNSSAREEGKDDLCQNDLCQTVKNAKSILLIPGYGMALAQAQHKIKQLADLFESNGADVQFAIHPVAGRMPGHMNVLLAEANIDYEKLVDLDMANPLFPQTDLVIIVGANDVVNPAAIHAEGTPIYGMPILRADLAKRVIVCNFDTKPGYAGVDNPLYTKEGVSLLLGDANASLDSLIHCLSGSGQQVASAPTQSVAPEATQERLLANLLTSSQNILLVPGYGMALAQAQYKIKSLVEILEARGAQVKFAIHPVAGRMPGHMNVLLAEANIEYEQLLDMEVANPLFATTDLVIVVGANDVINPAAIVAEGTPIYGMPILRVDQAKNVIICNFDTKPGYAGVDNPLYSNKDVHLLLGDASQSLDTLIGCASQKTSAQAAEQPLSQTAGQSLEQAKGQEKQSNEKVLSPDLLKNAKNVLIVPGYGMALAQAQHKVKQLAERFEKQGATVKFAIHPVAGRMPGHMNVLLAEANVDYEQLIDMDEANPLFAQADLAVVVGANDVINPAAIVAEGTPIYGMPILRADQAAKLIICNFDTKPGYAGVDNPLYTSDHAYLLLGDANASLDSLLAML